MMQGALASFWKGESKEERAARLKSEHEEYVAKHGTCTVLGHVLLVLALQTGGPLLLALPLPE